MCQQPRKNYKIKFLTCGWMLNIQKWFAKWNLEGYLESKEIDWKNAEKAFQASLWENWALSTKYNRFEYYCKHIMHYQKEDFLDAKGTMQTYLIDHLTQAQRSSLGQTQMRYHSLEIEKGPWASIPRSKRLCNVCKDLNAIADEEHVLLECPKFSHI